MPEIKFHTIQCCHEGCGNLFSIPDSLDDRFRKTHESFYCPNGHPQSYTAKNNEEKLKEQVAQREKENAAITIELNAAREREKEATEKLKTCELSLNSRKAVNGKLKKKIEELKK
jgi:hypothetical protein